MEGLHNGEFDETVVEGVTHGSGEEDKVAGRLEAGGEVGSTGDLPPHNRDHQPDVHRKKTRKQWGYDKSRCRCGSNERTSPNTFSQASRAFSPFIWSIFAFSPRRASAASPTKASPSRRTAHQQASASGVRCRCCACDRREVFDQGEGPRPPTILDIRQVADVQRVVRSASGSPHVRTCGDKCAEAPHLLHKLPDLLKRVRPGEVVVDNHLRIAVVVRLRGRVEALRAHLCVRRVSQTVS